MMWTWQDKENQTRYTTEIVANQIIFLGGARDAGMESGNSGFGSSSDSSSTGSGDNAFASSSSSEFDPSSGFMQEEDIPF